MKIKHRFVILFPLLFLMACAPRITIMLDGQPIPEYAYTLNNLQTGLSMEIVAAKYVKKYESGELVLWPVYLNVNKTHDVDPNDTSYVKIVIKVRNPNKALYELIESVSDKPSGAIKREILTNSMYKGRLRYKSFEIFYPITEEISRDISFEIKGKEGLTLCVIGDFSYKTIERRDANLN